MTENLIIPSFITRAKLSTGAKYLYGEIVRLNDKEPCFCIYETNKTLSKLLGKKSRTITRYLRELKNGNFIHIDVRKDADGTEREIKILHQKELLEIYAAHQ